MKDKKSLSDFFVRSDTNELRSWFCQLLSQATTARISFHENGKMRRLNILGVKGQFINLPRLDTRMKTDRLFIAASNHADFRTILIAPDDCHMENHSNQRFSISLIFRLLDKLLGSLLQNLKII